MMLISGAIISCDGNVLQSLSQDHNIIVLGTKLAAATIFLSQRNNRQDKTKALKLRTKHVSTFFKTKF